MTSPSSSIPEAPDSGGGGCLTIIVVWLMFLWASGVIANKVEGRVERIVIENCQ